MTLTNQFQHKVLNGATRMTFLVASLFAASIFTACDDDDDGGFRSVEGTWVGDKTELVMLVEGLPPITETDEFFSGTVEFKKNGTAVYSEDGDVITGTWSQKNNKLTLSIPDDSEEIDMSGTYTIQDISATKLKIFLEKEESFEDPDTGIEFDATLKATLYFDKD